MAAVDLSVSFPSRGVIRLHSRTLFGEVENPTCREFLGRVFEAAEITSVTIRGGRTPHADLRFCPRVSRVERIVERVVAVLRRPADRSGPPPNGPVTLRDRTGVVRYFRHGAIVTSWEIKFDQPGRLRLKNRALYRKSKLCQAIERELMTVLGIDQYRTSSLTCTVRVDYDPTQLASQDVIAILDAALAGAEDSRELDTLDWHLPLCTVSMPIAAAAQFAAPAFLPVAAGLFACTSIPTFREAHRALFREKRLGVDVLDAMVVVGCLGTMSILPGTVLCWCLSVGRALVKRTHDNSRKLLLNAFGKQPRQARLYRDGAGVQIPVDRIRTGDLIVVNAGEVVPVDGRVIAGRAMIDPHAMTGELVPGEAGVGDRVFASTLMIAGRVYVSAEAAGRETAASRIGRILDATAGYKLSSQRMGERLADRAVVPTLVLGAIGMAAMGPGGALAVLHRDLRSGLRMAAPLAMLGAVALCAHKGILVKDGRALELMNEVDTVLFDQSAAPADERPEFRDVVEGLRRRGIGHTAILSGEKAVYVAKLRAEGRKICFVGEGIDDAIAPKTADLTISLRGAASIANDAAQIVFLEDGLAKICDLRDIARDLDRNVKRSWSMILAPNIACVAGVFTMGFGIMASVLTNNLAALAALGNGVLPLRKVAQLEAERRHRLQIHQAVAAARSLGEAIDPEPEAATPCLADTGGAELASREAAEYDSMEWDLVRGASHASRPQHALFTSR
jgi:cation transport ATPase